MAVLYASVEIIEGSDSQALFRIDGSDGANIQQADVSTIAREIFDTTTKTPTVSIDSSAPVVADTIYDTLQTDSRWTRDSTGFNFADTIAGSVCSDGGRVYRVEYTMTGPLGEIYKAHARITTVEGHSD